MPKKTVSEKESTPSTNTASQSNRTRKLGSLGKSVFKTLKVVSTTQILVVLLIIASFLIGVLITKVSYLEKGGMINNQQQAAVPSAADQQAAQQQGLTDGQKVDVGVGHYPALGNDNAKVTIVEFADFRCPYCEQYFTQAHNQIYNEYIKTGKVKFYFRNFAFLGDASTLAADAAECANDQNKFWAYHDWLYQNQPDESDTSMYNVDNLTQTAVKLGLNGDTFKSCLSNKTGDAKVSQDMTEGQAAGVSGTPTFFINGTALVGAQPYSAFKTLIDQALK